jgi:hypothetical protein
VWLSNNYSNTGVEFARIEAFGGSVPDFVTDPFNQPTDLPPLDATNTEYNLVDPDFKYPQVLRTSLGYDHEFDFLGGVIATAEFVYTDNQEEVLYRDLNLQVSDTPFAADGRPVMEAVDPTQGPAYYLTNTDAGHSWNATFKIESPRKRGLYWSASYTRGDSRVLLDATSSRAVSNYVNLETSGNSNANTIGASDFLIEHRYVATLTYTKDWISGSPTTISAYYNLRSGRPYSYTYFDDINGDGSRFNDLIFVPENVNDIILTTNNYDALEAYIASDPALDGARGSIVERNTGREPWSHIMDLRLAQDISFSRVKLQLSLDIQNFLNLVNDEWGELPDVSFNNLSILGFEGYADDGTPMYSFFQDQNPDGSFDRTEINDTLSRWYAKFGLRLSF